MRDQVDRLSEAWRREVPELDMRAMESVGRILRAAALIGAEIDWFAHDRGVSRAEGDVILTLRRTGAPYELSQSELASSLLLTAGGLSRRLAELERNGLVTLTSVQPGSPPAVALTERGRALVDEFLPAHVANEDRILAPLDESEREMLNDLLARIVAPLEERHGH